jgi:hypothetical protein
MLFAHFKIFCAVFLFKCTYLSYKHQLCLFENIKTEKLNKEFREFRSSEVQRVQKFREFGTSGIYSYLIDLAGCMNEMR